MGRCEDLGRTRGPPKGTDDVAFIAKLVERLVANGTADPKRIYVAGTSNGGAMAMTLVRAPRRSVCGRCERESHRRGHGYLPRPRPMLIINGTADPLVPHEARIELFCRGRFLIDGGDAGLLAQAQRLRDRRRCGDRHADRGPADQSTVTRRRRRARSPQPGRPPHARLLSRCALPEDRGSPLGPQNADIDGAETIWMCFSRFPSGRACFAGNACVPGVAQHSALG
ncbi:PHB depolymerase family esterase [Bradyrhizobium sp. LLZ17]|uniref:PHB depolymerase family esterase n=1 Tax=Bradyrhizobium sp. LLZ17 TaxID=3239388 RepID=UPI00350F05F9